MSSDPDTAASAAPANSASAAIALAGGLAVAAGAVTQRFLGAVAGPIADG